MNTPYPVMREAIIDAALAAIRTTLITETKPACIDGYFFQSPTYHVVTPDPHEGQLTILLRNYPRLGEDTPFTISRTLDQSPATTAEITAALSRLGWRRLPNTYTT